MKYLNNYTNFICEDGSFPDIRGKAGNLLEKLKNTLSIVGFLFKYENKNEYGRGFNYNNYLGLTTDANINMVPYSIMKIILGVNDRSKVLAREEGSPWSKLDKDLTIAISYHNIMGFRETINPKTREEAYTKVIDFHINRVERWDGIFREITDNTNLNGLEINLKSLVLEYLRNNRNIDDFNIPKTIIDVLHVIISNSEDKLTIYNNIKLKQPIIYDDLCKYYDNIEMGSKLGEIGF